MDRRTVLQNAQLFASRGQFDAAIAEWKKLTVESPTDGTIFNSIGDLHLKRNATGDAIGAYLQAAAAFRAEGSTLKAIAAYKKVLKVDPSRFEVYRHLGDLNAERGLLSSAVQDYLALAKHYLKDRKTKEALEIYRCIVTQDPTNLDAQERVAELCLQENLKDEAVQVYLQVGRERSAQQRCKEAKDAYQAVLRIDPGNPEAKEIMSALERDGAPPAPSASQSKSGGPSAALQKGAEGGDLLAEAMRRMEEGQFAGAEAILTQLLSREPGNPQICQSLARLHLQQGNHQVALGEYRFLAGAALRAQDYTLAEALIREYLQAVPQSVPLLELLGELYEEKGDIPTAVEQYGRAVEALIQHPEPGMPTLPTELYEKMKTLAPSSPAVAKVAAHFDTSAAGAVRSSEPVSQDTEVSPQAETDVPLIQEAATQPLRLVDSADSTPSPTEPTPTTEPAQVSAESSAQTGFEDGLDADTHYTLGVAYKNMGLIEEAKEELVRSMKDARYYLDSCLMVSLCLKEQMRIDQAIHLLERLVGDPRSEGSKGQSIRYELGRLYELTNAPERAVSIYESIPSFEDVPHRLAAIRNKQANGSQGLHAGQSRPVGSQGMFGKAM